MVLSDHTFVRSARKRGWSPPRRPLRCAWRRRRGLPRRPRRADGRALRRAVPLRPSPSGADRCGPGRRRSGTASARVPARPRARRERANANGAFFAALRTLGTRAPVVVFPNGGEHLLLPRPSLGQLGALRARRGDPPGGPASGGRPAARWRSAGSRWADFGAFAIARRRPSRFFAVGGHSAALWLRSGDTAPGAFDNAADYGRHDLIRVARARGRAPWGSARLWLDGGRAPVPRRGRALRLRAEHPHAPLGRRA